MIDPGHGELTILRQCQLVGISRSACYGSAKGENALNLSLMRLIDAQFWRRPGMVHGRWHSICAARATRSGANVFGG